MRVLLTIFLVLAIAFPAVAIGNAFDKAWSEAPPGWYLKISYNQGWGHYPNTRSTNWWKYYPPPVFLPPEDELASVSGNIDEGNKPVFVRKLLFTSSNPPPGGCLQNIFVFRVDGGEINVYDPSSHDFTFEKCRLANKWELLRKSCGNENFIGCISDKFSTKFPFDILFNLPSTQITCPRINFFDSEFDLCFIYEAMRLMKYPIAAALVIKLFLYL